MICSCITCGYWRVQLKSISRTRLLTAGADLGPKYLGDTTLISSFRNRNLATSGSKPVHRFMHVSRTRRPWRASHSLVDCTLTASSLVATLGPSASTLTLSQNLSMDRVSGPELEELVAACSSCSSDDILATIINYRDTFIFYSETTSSITAMFLI